MTQALLNDPLKYVSHFHFSLDRKKVAHVCVHPHLAESEVISKTSFVNQNKTLLSLYYLYCQPSLHKDYNKFCRKSLLAEISIISYIKRAKLI